jgi:hypothetical protein
MALNNNINHNTTTTTSNSNHTSTNKFQTIMKKTNLKNLTSRRNTDHPISMYGLMETILTKVPLNSPLEQQQADSSTSIEKLKQSRIVQQQNNLKHNHDLELHLQRQHQLHNENQQHQDSFLKKFSTRNSNVDDQFIQYHQKRFLSIPNKVINEEEKNETKEETNNIVIKNINENDDNNNSMNCSTKNININMPNETYVHPTVNNNTNTKTMFKRIIESILIRFNYFVISPDDNCIFVWLLILNICFLYNIWIVIARQSFEILQNDYKTYWKIFDGLSDSIYLIDILVQFRTGYLEQGLLVYNSKKLAFNYVKSKKFLMDLFSMTPLELIQFVYKKDIPMLRFPRFFKFYRFIELYYISESIIVIIRVRDVQNFHNLRGFNFFFFSFLIDYVKFQYCM